MHAGLVIASMVSDTQSNVHVTTDAGATWAARATPATWYTVTVSGNGRYLYAMDGNGVHSSADGGLTWRTPTRPCTSCDLTVYGFASGLSTSNDGRVVAFTQGAFFRISLDYGATWRQTNTTWPSTATNTGEPVTSRDGSTTLYPVIEMLSQNPYREQNTVYVVYASSPTYMVVGGNRKDFGNDVYSVACSDDGSVIVASTSDGYVAMRGVTWQDVMAAKPGCTGGCTWRLAVSGSGQSIIMARGYSDLEIQRSNDGGKSWTANKLQVPMSQVYNFGGSWWAKFADDGSVLLMTTGTNATSPHKPAAIYSFDGGNTWVPQPGLGSIARLALSSSK